MQPLLHRNDAPGLCATIKQNWSQDDMLHFLQGDHADARKVAALALGLLGAKKCIESLARQLSDTDPMVNQMAEHALWSIWFRCGHNGANKELMNGLRQLNTREFDQAIAHFSRAIELDPDFAEAYNQRAIAHYLREEYEASADDCQATVDRMKHHFGAWAGMGHCFAHLGKLREAIYSYQHAVDINPHLSCVRDALQELKQRVGD